MADPLFKSTLLAQTQDPLENQKAALDLLKKVNDVHALSTAGIDAASASAAAAAAAAAAAQATANDTVLSGSTATGEWIKFSNGTLIQYGATTTGISNNADANRFGSTSGNMYFAQFTVIFPLPFLTSPGSIIAQDIIDGGANDGVGNTRISAITGSQFNLLVWGGSTSGVIVKAYWIAIGKWK